MRKLADAVPLPAMMEQIAANRVAYRAERCARFGWPETISCPACGDTGRNPDRPLSACLCPAGEGLATERRRVDRWERTVPAAMRGWTLATAPDESAAAAVTAWIAGYPSPNGFTANLILYGRPGTGKTGIAIGALAALVERDVNVAFYVVADFLDRLRPQSPDPVQAATLREAQRTAVLVLDDLGAERPKDWGIERLYVVLNERMNAGKPTIITTNLEDADLPEVLGERLLRRVIQDDRATEVVVRKVAR